MNTDIAITQESCNQPIPLQFPSTTEHLPQSETENQNAETPRPLYRKIAKLPRPLRALINTSLDDGLPARQIIVKLQASIDPPLPYPISEVNISDWRKTGYQQYLNQQERLALIQANHEAALEMVAANDTLTLPEAGLQIIASQYFEFLGSLSPAALKDKLVEDPLKYTRFLNVYARLVREMVHLRKHRDKIAVTAQPQSINPDHRALVDQFDAFMRAPHSTPAPNIEKPISPDREPSPARSNSDLSTVSIPAASGIENPASVPPLFQNPNSKIENCLDCGSPLPPVPPHSLRRPEDHCPNPNCGMRLPDIGLCFQPGFDHCLSCGATQPALLPDNQRPRLHCHKCGVRLHNPETS